VKRELKISIQNRKGESMKKKLALLLALTMVLSLIPMNVFGATRIQTGQVVSSLPANTQAFVHIDLADLSTYPVTNQEFDYRYPKSRYSELGEFDGYPISITLDKGAHFGTAPGYTVNAAGKKVALLNNPFMSYNGGGKAGHDGAAS
jgi:hypothetical protein